MEKNPRMIVAEVSGVCDGKSFAQKLTFTRIDPDPNEPHYGSGEYVSVKFDGRADLAQLLDNRYARRNLVDVATLFLNNWFGSNMHGCTLHVTFDDEPQEHTYHKMTEADGCV